MYSERGNKELQLADVLSPASRKKTGRAYVALARAHSEKCVLSFDILFLTQTVSCLDETLTEVTSTLPLNCTAKLRRMSRITSSSERGGYFSSSMSFYVNCA